MNPAESGPGPSTLEQWKDQIRFAATILKDGAIGFNRAIAKIDKKDVTNQMLTIDPNNECPNMAMPLALNSNPNKRVIESIVLHSFTTDKQPTKNKYGLNPSKPLPHNFYSNIVKNPDTTDRMLKQILARVTNIEYTSYRHLLTTEEGERTYELALEASKKDYIDTISSIEATSETMEFKLWGQPGLEGFLKKQVIDMIENENYYRNFGINFPDSFLLYGAPGCGKTSAINKLAKAIGFEVYPIDSSTIGSQFIHQTSKNISSVFKDATKNAPSIIIMDEVDAILSESHKYGEHTASEVATLLKFMDTASENKILIVGMTNNLDKLSDAAKRPGRFTNQFEVKPLEKQDIKDLLCHIFEGIETNRDVSDMESAAEYLAGKGQCTIADVYSFKKSLCMVAAAARLPEIDQTFVNKYISELQQ